MRGVRWWMGYVEIPFALLGAVVGQLRSLLGGGGWSAEVAVNVVSAWAAAWFVSWVVDRSRVPKNEEERNKRRMNWKLRAGYAGAFGIVGLWLITAIPEIARKLI